MTGPASAHRVAFVSEHLESAGGLELFELAIAEGLSAAGWDVEVSFATAGNLRDRWAAAARLSPTDGPRSRDEVVRDADVVYVHSPHLFRPALDAAADRRPVVGHLHLPPFHHRPGWKGLIRGRHRWPMDPDVYSRRTRLAAFAAVSQFTGSQWVASGLPADRVHVIHNGVDPTVHHPATPADRLAVRNELGCSDDEFVVGYFGRIDVMKGIDVMLDGFRELLTSEPRARLLVAGAPTKDSGEEGRLLLERLRADAPPEVTWLGKRDDVARLYHALDVFVMPSRWDEPFGLVLTEAMASGVPVIASRRGGIPEILTGELAACLVEPESGQVAGRLRATAAGDRRHLGELGIARVAEAFTVERTVGSVAELLHGVVRSAERSSI